MSFQLTPLAGNSTLVEGMDSRGKTGSEVLDSTQWDSLQLHGQHTTALAKVDEAIELLLAPIQEAIDEANAVIKRPTIDSLLVYVEQEGSDAVAGRQSIVHRLTRDSVIIRAVTEGQTDRLIWVNDELVVTAAQAPAPTTGKAKEFNLTADAVGSTED